MLICAGVCSQSVSMFASPARDTTADSAAGGVQTLPALGGVIVVAPQMGFIMAPARKWAIWY